MAEEGLLEYDDEELQPDTEVDESSTRSEMSYDEGVPNYDITSIGKDIDTDGYVKRLRNDAILTPDFQRKYIWKTPRASLLIESLYIGLPIPQLFFFEDKDGGWLIIDGLQRLTTIKRFYNDEFQLKAPGLSTELRGKKYSQLSPTQKLRLDNASIRAVILRQDSPDDENSSVYQLFHRINTQSSPLSAQEIRSCVSRGRFNELLQELNRGQVWRSIFGAEHSRLKDRELILRFFALHTNIDNYRPPMTRFLDDFMMGHKNAPEETIDEFRQLFTSTIQRIWAALDTDSFRPRPQNRTLILTNFDAVMHGVAKSVKDEMNLSSDQIEAFAENLLGNDSYQWGTEEFTNDLDRVEARLAGAEQELAKL